LTIYVVNHIITSLEAIMATVPYDSLTIRKKHPVGSDLARFSEAFSKQIQEEYELTFGLGQLLSDRRQELHISQADLSQETGIPQADISRIECGHANPTLRTVEKLLGALNLRITISTQ